MFNWKYVLNAKNLRGSLKIFRAGHLNLRMTAVIAYMGLN